MNIISEFNVSRYTSNLGVETDTWRWMPHDYRAQPLYRSGFLAQHAPEVAADFETQVRSAYLWLVGSEVHYEQVDDAIVASVEQKIEILDGFVWLGSASFRVPPIDHGAPGFWERHETHDDDHDWVSETEFLAVLDGALEYRSAVDAEGVAEHTATLAAEYDAKAARYRKIGWDDADIEAEFGPHPEPKTPRKKN